MPHDSLGRGAIGAAERFLVDSRRCCPSRFAVEPPRDRLSNHF
jgi:hypothetical protein